MQKRPQIAVHTLLVSETLLQTLPKCLSHDRYTLVSSQNAQDFLNHLGQQKHHVDCLILEQNHALPQVIRSLHRDGTFLPAIIVQEATLATQSPESPEPDLSEPSSIHNAEAQYHNAEVILTQGQLPQLPQHIDTALTSFLRLATACRLTEPESGQLMQQQFNTQQNLLSEKLKERLGYLGIYYKRNPQHFLRNLSNSERQKLLRELKVDYQAIILNYFRKDSGVNQRIDEFVNKAFFADISVSQVLEIHMELMDLLAKKLKLEGRSEEILLDYRLTLIDAISHLCEMYRRSIPRDH
ncbi:circadian clock protein KaiA [Synechococcales cyanobacterium C]|uniref:Circadian clock oscillator protein KaiA n=1 Tax=Petrachloros mirabilis ULC683 TaxID=2781853 RepID=A0A8K2A846_9CYAN|nr:circadian clock protein KaiA [Petrachloros mirabilis ULC683]